MILAFGDSLTAGKGAARDQSYPAELARLSHKTVINAGISGEISAAGLRRLPALLDKHQPELLILCHGGNDILRKLDLDKTRQNLETMIQLAKQRGIQVLVLAVPRPKLILSAPEFYLQAANNTGVPIDNDIMSSVLSDRQLKADSFHPNAAGYAVIARHIHERLNTQGAL